MRALFLTLLALSRLAGQSQGDYVAHDFTFTTGEKLAEVRIHYTTLGTPRKDARGVVRNAVLILHGTGGTGRGFLSANYGGVAFPPGGIFDTTKYFVVLPDNVGHGGSSKPSDGLHQRFPHYTYDDMVKLQYLMLTEGLKVNHLRLVTGTSMGCMHSWVWVEMYPDFMDGAVPLACAPTPIAGRNRMIRTLIKDAISTDPDFNGGEYTKPLHGMLAAEGFLYMMTSAPKVQHRMAPDNVKADSIIHAYVKGGASRTDPNDMMYYFDASREYDPSQHLERITAPILHINSADDFVNPPELGNVQPYIDRLKNAKFILIPISDQTRGHGTHSLPAIWGNYVREFMASLPERSDQILHGRGSLTIKTDETDTTNSGGTATTVVCRGSSPKELQYPLFLF